MCINIPLLISFTTIALSSAPMGTCTARVGPICSWHESKDFFPQKNSSFFLLQWGQRSLAISLHSPSYRLVVLLVEGCWATYPHLAHLYKIVDIWGLQSLSEMYLSKTIQNMWNFPFWKGASQSTYGISTVPHTPAGAIGRRSGPVVDQTLWPTMIPVFLGLNQSRLSTWDTQEKRVSIPSVALRRRWVPSWCEIPKTESWTHPP